MSEKLDPPLIEGVSIRVRQETRYHVSCMIRGHRRSKSFSNMRNAARWVAIWQLRQCVVPIVEEIFRNANGALSEDAVKVSWLAAYGRVFPPDECCRCCQRDFWDEGDGHWGFDRLAEFCLTKRREYIRGLTDQIIAEWKHGAANGQGVPA